MLPELHYFLSRVERSTIVLSISCVKTTVLVANVDFDENFQKKIGWLDRLFYGAICPVLSHPARAGTHVMYLTSKENYQPFQQLGDIVGARGSTIAFDFFHLDDFGRPINSNTQKESSWITAFMKYKVKVFGEPFRWGIALETLPSFLQDTGWSLVPASESKFFLQSSAQDEASRHAIMMGLEYEATVEWAGR